MGETWDDLRDTKGLRLGPAAFRYQSCPRCRAEVDTLRDDGRKNHDDTCQPSFRTTLTPYATAVQRALRGL
jgi:hypothetical protein